MVGPQVLPGMLDFGADAGEQLIVNDFALAVGLLVEVEDFDEVGSLAGQFLISHDVHVQLVEGDVVG